MPEETATTRFQALARLHVSCLPESLISLLGLSFANQLDISKNLPFVAGF